MPPLVLVVEDDLSTQHLLCAVAQHLGLQPLVAGDGGQALTMIEAEVPAAMILDLLMPHVDGFEVLRRLKTSAPDLLGRTVVVTAAMLPEHELRELECARKSFRKPLDIHQLGAALLECVSQTAKGNRDGAYETPSRS